MDPKQQPPYPLRMPTEMRSHYEDLAQASKRSLNAEIVAALQEVQALRDRAESLERELYDLRLKNRYLMRRENLASEEKAKAAAHEEGLAGALKAQRTATKVLAQIFVLLSDISRPKEGMDFLFEQLQEVGKSAADGEGDSLRETLDATQQAFATYMAGFKARLAQEEAPASAASKPLKKTTRVIEESGPGGRSRKVQLTVPRGRKE